MSTDKQSTALQIIEALEASLNTSDDLIELLKSEQLALTKRDSDQIQVLTQTKQGLLKQLEQESKQCKILLNQAGEQILEEFIIGLDGEHQKRLGTLWQRQQDALQILFQQNAINGTIVNVRKQHTDRLLNILKGRSHASLTYGADGGLK